MFTAESSVEDIAAIVQAVSVRSLPEWQDQENYTKQKSKKAKALRYYCQYGIDNRAGKRTEVVNWAEFYTDSDKADLDAFRDKVEAYILKSITAKMSDKLSSRLKTAKKIKPDYITKADVQSDENSDSEQSSMESSVDENNSGSSDDDEMMADVPRSARKRLIDFVDDDDTSVDVQEMHDSPHTPRKKRINTNGRLRTPRTPRTPKQFTIVSTPGSKRYRTQAPLEVTPLPSRIAASENQITLSPHQLARQRLHVAEVPTSLPCREEEFASIFEQVESAILENESALIYISGTPGTGKTATVREVIAALQQKVADEELFPFNFVEINGMKIPDPSQAYSKLWETLTGQRVTPSHALSLLQTQFTTRNPSRMPCVVLMDELDQLTTTKQEVMYNFFQWPNMPNTKLIVVAVANTMDLPERTLAHKVSSRLGLSRIAFTAYTRAQLNEIIKSRLSSVESIDVDNDAIDYACLRVSRVSGDARRALDICRRAFELAEPGFDSTPATPQKLKQQRPNAGRVTIAEMKRAFEEMTSSPLQVYLMTLPLASKILLKAIISCMRRSGLSEVSLGDAVEDTTRMSKINTDQNLQIMMGQLHPVGMIRTAFALADSGILYVEDVRKGERHARVRLKVSETDLLSSWAEDADLASIA